MSVRTLSDHVALRPVLELSPGDLGRVDEPDWVSSEEDDEAYWHRCLAQAGLAGARPVCADSWLVYADDLVEPAPILSLLAAHLAEPARSTKPRRVPSVPPLQGGFALLDRDEVVLIPRCCGDLGDLVEWNRATSKASAEPMEMWTGHPALSVWREGDYLYLREEQEDGYPPEPRTLRVRRDALAAAVRRARDDVDAFLQRLLRALDVGQGHDGHGAMGRALVGRAAHA